MSGLVLLCRRVAVGHVVTVEVPVEAGLASLLQSGENLLLHLLHDVEADEEVCVVVEVDTLVGGHLAVHHSFIGNPLVLKALAEIVVDVL